ncbi:MAG: DNA/RNA nuclease SfsA [Holophagaceae bacterium]|nr:DNA/RNA nuclease SfsA [Holophagaceae bacterium]
MEKRDLMQGRIVNRYKRFLADVELPDGTIVTAHTTNTGSMTTCWAPGDAVLLSHHDDPARKLKYTWLACKHEGAWVGVETGMPNRVVADAARSGTLPSLPGLVDVLTEQKYGSENSRIDVLARDAEGRRVYIEVKNTTLKIGSQACFPDAVTERGRKHLRELRGMVEQGHRAALVFFIHRDDVDAFDVAREIDPAYAQELDRATAAWRRGASSGRETCTEKSKKWPIHAELGATRAIALETKKVGR